MPRPTTRRAFTWAILIARIYQDHPMRWRRLRLALEHPERYGSTFRKELAARGVAKPVPRLPLIAFFDRLASTGRVALLDWKTPASEVVAALKKLKTTAKLSWAWLKPFHMDELDDLATSRFLQAVADELSGKSLDLVNLDTASDELAITVVERARVGRASPGD